MNRLANEVKVIFLDAGGVLFDTCIKKDERIRRLMAARGYQKIKINNAIKKANLYEQDFFYENKLVTNWNEEEQFFKSYYRIIAKELGNIELTNELFYFTHYASHCMLFPEVKGVLEALRTNYRLGVISNAMPSMDWIFDRLEIRKYFESIILSAFVNEAKPGEAIYNVALKKLQTNKNESIFIDDKMENIIGAEQVGISGFHLEREKINLLELLKKEKIL